MFSATESNVLIIQANILAVHAGIEGYVRRAQYHHCVPFVENELLTFKSRQGMLNLLSRQLLKEYRCLSRFNVFHAQS
jgi:hypothetical protein